MAEDPETNNDYEGKINMLTHLYSNLLVNCGARSSTEILTQTFTFCCHINDRSVNFPTEIVL